MSRTVILDAMIRREDFAAAGDPSGSAEPIKTLSIQSISSTGMLVPLLRKPDFQRETNHWTPEQVVSFLESFLDNELIPSVILWKSDAFVFVIDGGHRLSALRAWIEDDYGDGTVSIGYFSNEIGAAQKKIAKKTQKMVDERIGKYALIKDALLKPDNYPQRSVQRARNMATRELSLQWVNGDAEKAESSFFKINTQGTPLDDAEELLLRNRKRSIAIAARSIIRAGTGHKYWSKFSDNERNNIEQNARKLHVLFFSPEVDSPIKTLDLPLGGSKSPLDALEMLMQLVSITNGKQGEFKKPIGDFDEDLDGSKTSQVLEQCFLISSRVTGNGPGSLGLHPAIYFYSERGRHLPDLLLGTLLLFRQKIQNGDKAFFKNFTIHREKIEDYIIKNKSLISQAIQIARSQTRYLKVAELLEFLVNRFTSSETFSDEEMVGVIAPSSISKILAVQRPLGGGGGFSDDTKSAIFLKNSLKSAVTCQLCNGKIDVQKAVSYDHVVRKVDGGSNSDENGQLTHPFCNTGMKG
jgi:hypothetical protein